MNKMKAIISPLDSVENGYKIIKVYDDDFPINDVNVTIPVFWVSCDESVTPQTHYYDPLDQTIKQYEGNI